MTRWGLGKTRAWKGKAYRIGQFNTEVPMCASTSEDFSQAFYRVEVGILESWSSWSSWSQSEWGVRVIGPEITMRS